MKKVFAIIVLATAVSVSGSPAFAQQQGSNQATDYALSWDAAGGSSTAYGDSYARFGYVRHPHRAH